jgi:hypothetical protein
MQKCQTRQISAEALKIYESMTHKVNTACNQQHQQLDIVRNQCAGQFEEDIFRLVEDLEVKIISSMFFTIFLISLLAIQ